jgi:hypothetical protein
MILEEAPESAKQLCTLKLKISNVSRKGGTWDLECDPILGCIYRRFSFNFSFCLLFQ